MGLRFRKSFGKGPFRVTISNKGVSTSVGVKGARITKKANGKISTTVGIPGTGLSYTSTSKSNKKKSNTTNIKSKSNSQTIKEPVNMFSKFNLSKKELELFDFLINNNFLEKEEFTIHEVSCLGCVMTATYYNNLYNKGLLLKPNKGKYALNKTLLNKMVEEEELRKKKIAEEEKLRKERREKILKTVCKYCFIPMLTLGMLYSFVDIATGLFYIGIGLLEWRYYKKHK